MYPMSTRAITRLVCRFVGLTICLVALVTVSAFGQTGSATLRGTVKDPAGAILRGATVTLTNERTKEERKTTTSDDGNYVFAAVTPGQYTLKLEAPGFKTSELAHVALETSDQPLLVSHVDLSEARLGGASTDIVASFLRELSNGASLTLHVRLLDGSDAHNVLEAIFKALGTALAQACRPRKRKE